MRPALSLVLFTTAAGIGFGLLLVLGFGVAFGILPTPRAFGAWSLGAGLALVTLGLIASTAHLGRPERAWRAFSQWRSSWLSREAVAALATFALALLLGWGWLDGTPHRGVALLTGLGAATTLWCTGQIYATLKPVTSWHQRLTSPLYLMLGVAGGAILAAAAARCAGQAPFYPDVAALVTLCIAWGIKLAWWKRADSPSPSTPETATGLGSFGKVGLLQPPHTGESYLTTEMAFAVARKHAIRLRKLSIGLGFGTAWGGIVMAGLVGTGGLATGCAVTALLAALAGTFIERWLFFAEAKHTVILYYGAATA